MKLLLFPFAMLWKLVALVIQLTGRLVGITLGLAIALVGALLTLTGIGAILGIPLMGLGFLLIARGLF